jgi:hypothetical protein
LSNITKEQKHQNQQRLELAIQKAIRKSEDSVVKLIEEALNNSDYQKFKGNPNDKKLEESQFRNVVSVADSTESPEVIKNFLRYQTGREKKWGRGKNSLAETIIRHIDGDLRKLANEISEQTSRDKFKEIWLDLIRRYLGYGSRHLLYLNTPKEK